MQKTLQVSKFTVKFLNDDILFSKLILTQCEKNVIVIEKNLKFEADGLEFANIFKLLDQFIQAVNGQYNF